MTIKSRVTAPVPRCSLQQWIFGSSQAALDDTRVFMDPARPETHFVTKDGYRLLAKRIALGLQRAGLQEGDRVLLFSGNALHVPSLFLGVLMAGGIFSGANPTFVARELAYQLRDAGASFLVVAAAGLAVGLEAAALAGLGTERVYVLDDAAETPADVPESSTPARSAVTLGLAVEHGVHHWLDLVDGDVSEARAWNWREPDDPAATTCCLNYSSGTTGVPKGVEIAHGAYVANCHAVVSAYATDPEAEARRARNVALCILPLYHAYGQTYFVATFPHMGVPTYVMPKFDFAAMLAHIARFRVATLAIVPPIAVLLAKHPLAKQADLSSVEFVGSGAASMSAETAAAIGALLPHKIRGEPVPVVQGWGMTEVTCSCIGWMHDTQPAPPTDRTENSGSNAVGELVPNAMARLVDVTSPPDRPRFITQANTRGELWVAGPSVMRGYWRNETATQSTIWVDADGTRWLRTGDIAFVDRYGPGACFFIVDRIKELIKVKGNQVAPAELEALLLERDDIADAAVVGVSVGGEERPRAYVVPQPNTRPDAADIAAWVAERVAPYKRLVGGVVFCDAIPKNPSGKILRNVLRAQAKAQDSPKL